MRRAAVALGALAAMLAAGAGAHGSSAAFTASLTRPASTFGTASDWVAPVVTLTAPADAASITDATPTLSGAAGTAAGDGSTVTVRIHAGPDATGTATQTFTATRSGSSWSATAATLPDGTYTARASQTDSAGNTGTSAARTFTVDTGKPQAASLATANRSAGTSGRLESGDAITFAYSEPIAPTSVLSSFTGSSATVTVRFVDNNDYGDLLTVLDGSGAATVKLDIGASSGYGGGVYTAANLVTDTVNFTGSTLTRSSDGTSFRVVLGSPDRSWRIVSTRAGAGNMIWAPIAGPTDLAGNPLAGTSWVAESDDDRDF
jgi:hypothetical protein